MSSPHRTAGNPSPNGRRAVRRQATVSHPPRRWDLLGGRHMRELTLAQRERIAELIERPTGAFGIEAEIKAVVDGRQSPTRRLHRLLAQAQEDA